MSSDANISQQDQSSSRSVTFQLSPLEDAIVQLRKLFPNATSDQIYEFLKQQNGFSNLINPDFSQAFLVTSFLLTRANETTTALPSESAPNMKNYSYATPEGTNEQIQRLKQLQKLQDQDKLVLLEQPRQIPPVTSNASPSAPTANSEPEKPSQIKSKPSTNSLKEQSPKQTTSESAAKKVNGTVVHDATHLNGSTGPSKNKSTKSEKSDGLKFSDLTSLVSPLTSSATPASNNVDNKTESPTKSSLDDNSLAEVQENVEWWKSQGNKHFQSKKFEDARACYFRALEHLNRDNLLSTLLHNISATYFHLSFFDKSFRCAFASIAVSPSAKAYYRAAKALQKIKKCEDQALWCALEAEKLGASQKDIADLVKELQAVTNIENSDEDMSARVLKTVVVADVPSDKDVNWDEVKAVANMSSVVNEKKDPAALKEFANAEFRAGRLSNALGLYLFGLSNYSGPATALFNYIAACDLKRATYDSRLFAILYSCASLVLNKKLLVSYHRCGVAIRDLKWHIEGKYFIIKALSIFPDEPTLLKFQKEYEFTIPSEFMPDSSSENEKTVLKGKTEPAKSTTPKPPAQKMTETKSSSAVDTKKMPEATKSQTDKTDNNNFVIKSQKRGIPRSELIYRVADMPTALLERFEIEAMSSRNKIIKQLGRNSDVWDYDPPIPTFHRDFFERKDLPPYAKRNEIETVLQDAYWFARSIGWIRETFLSSKIDSEDIMASHALFFAGRVQNDIPGVHAWLSNPEAPKVRFNPRAASKPEVIQSFSNAAHQGALLIAGTVHVAVGFCDLGELSSSMILSEPNSGPLKWIGYDENPYCVAKTLCILCMIQQDATVDEIIQVWYSATWKSTTLKKFQTAAETLVSKNINSKIDPLVKSIINGWQNHEIPLQGANELWLHWMHDSFYKIPNWLDPEDRHALTKYMISGQIFSDGEFGNTTMFAVDSDDDREFDESFLQTIKLDDLLERRSSDAKNIVEAGVSILRDRVKHLIEAIKCKRLVVDARFGKVTPKNQELLSRINSLKPRTMSWSNVCDYFMPKEFHAMARKCSLGCDTIHHMYSTAWPLDVKGAWMLDYLSTATFENRKEYVESAIDKLTMMFERDENLKKFHRSPPLDSAMSIADYVMRDMNFASWVKEFFRIGGVEDLRRQVSWWMPGYNVLSRTNTEVFLCFTYSPNVDFQ